MFRALVLFACLLPLTTGLISVQTIDSRKGNDLNDADEAAPPSTATQKLAAAGWGRRRRRRWCSWCERKGKQTAERTFKAGERSQKWAREQAGKTAERTKKAGERGVKAGERAWKLTERNGKIAIETSAKWATENADKGLEIAGKVLLGKWNEAEEWRKGEQERLDKDQHPYTSESNETEGCGAGERNLAAILDGSGCWPEKVYDMHYPLGKVGNVHLVKLFRSLEVSCDQFTHYQSGVGSGAADQYILGVGVSQHGDVVYDWLLGWHNAGDRIFLFGYSRGTLSARYVQGRLGDASDGLEGARADFIGLFDAVYRTMGAWRVASWFVPLWAGALCALGLAGGCSTDWGFSTWDVNTDNIQQSLMNVLAAFTSPPGDGGKSLLKLEVDSATKTLRHAVGMDEPKAAYESGEILVVGSDTDAETVWFPGTHFDLGGMAGETYDANYVYIADAALDAGLLLAADWAEGRRVDPAGDVYSEVGLETMDSFGNMIEIRNPAKCRAEAGFEKGKHPIKLHQFVKDRQAAITGWVPTPYCCGHFKTAMEGWGISYVSSRTYDSIVVPATTRNQWVKVHIGTLSGARVFQTAKPTFLAFVDTWHQLTQDNAEPKNPNSPRGGMFIGDKNYWGCCHARVVYHDGIDAQLQMVVNDHLGRYDVDFGGRTTTIPYESDVGQGVLIQMKNRADNRNVGHRVLQYNDESVLTMVSRPLESSDRGGPSLGARLEFLTSDAAAVPGLPGSSEHSGHAQCRWLWGTVHKTGYDESFPKQKTGWAHWVGKANLCQAGHDDPTGEYYSQGADGVVAAVIPYVAHFFFRHLMGLLGSRSCAGTVDDAMQGYHDAVETDPVLGTVVKAFNYLRHALPSWADTLAFWN